MKGKYIAAVVVSGCLWGFMGFITRLMGNLGIAPPGVILVRCAIGALGFAVTLLLTDTKQFKVRPRDFWCFFGSGILSLLFFTYCYFTAITIMSLSAASILLYTAPSFVMLMSIFLFKESFSLNKLVALLLSFLGCALVSGIIGSDVRISAYGLGLGLCAGFGYALYSIFARFALNRGYSSNTINFYSCLLAALGAAAIFGAREPFAAMFSSGNAVLICVFAGIFTCYLPYLLYTYGLTGLENGTASIIASVEPVVATALGIVIFKEPLSLSALAGIGLVLFAIVLLNIKNRVKSGKDKSV